MKQQLIEEVMKQQGYYISTTSGWSMYPMLRDRRDTVILSPMDGRTPAKYDVVLYKSSNTYVLHRVIEVRPEILVIRGDNCLAKEYIPRKEIIGVMTGCYRGEKEWIREGKEKKSYWLYCRIWNAIFPLRGFYKRVMGKLRRL